MTRLLLALLLAAAVGGCALNDCSFETTEVSSFDTVRADAAGLGDTLTVVFVRSPERWINVFVQAGLRPIETTEGETVSLAYEADGLELGDVSPPRPPRFASTRRGDTLYVYVEGDLPPDLFTEVCSPPEAYLRIDILSVDAPATVRAVRVTTVDVYELEADVRAALRQSDAERPRPAIVA